MGATKYPVIGKDFPLKIIGACRDAEERGLIKLLLLTGMHISCVSSNSGLPIPKMVKRGRKSYIEWKRTKNRKTLSFRVPNEYIEDIEAFLNDYRRKTRRHYHNLVKDIGQRAGYEDISPNTLRHTVCVRLLQEGYHPIEVAHKLGCTLDVVVRNYAQLREDQSMRDVD